MERAMEMGMMGKKAWGLLTMAWGTSKCSSSDGDDLWRDIDHGYLHCSLKKKAWWKGGSSNSGDD